MRQHAEVVQAWLDGKDIQYRYENCNNWLDVTEKSLANPMTYRKLGWRVKPEVKQVDYQVVIDSELLVSFYNMFDSGYLMDKLKSHNEDRYADHSGNYWDCIGLMDNLRQVVSASALKKLILGGWDVKEILSYSESHEEDEQVVIILKGVQEGYTL